MVAQGWFDEHHRKECVDHALLPPPLRDQWPIREVVKLQHLVGHASPLNLAGGFHAMSFQNAATPRPFLSFFVQIPSDIYTLPHDLKPSAIIITSASSLTWV